MKTKLLLTLLLAVILLPTIFSKADASEPDTIWTTEGHFQLWFTPDGTKLLRKYGVQIYSFV